MLLGGVPDRHAHRKRGAHVFHVFFSSSMAMTYASFLKAADFSAMKMRRCTLVWPVYLPMYVSDAKKARQKLDDLERGSQSVGTKASKLRGAWGGCSPQQNSHQFLAQTLGRDTKTLPRIDMRTQKQSSYLDRTGKPHYPPPRLRSPSPRVRPSFSLLLSTNKSANACGLQLRLLKLRLLHSL